MIQEYELKLLLKALSFAARKHKDQRRKDVDASPYINHPISLANILCNEGDVIDAEVIAAALLHDTVEDTDTIPQELEQEFGAAVRDIVMAVTDDKLLPPHVRKELQISHAHRISPQAKLVKLADKISNVRDMIDARRLRGIWIVARPILIGPRRWWINCAARTPPWKMHSTGRMPNCRAASGKKVEHEHSRF